MIGKRVFRYGAERASVARVVIDHAERHKNQISKIIDLHIKDCIAKIVMGT